MNMGMCVPDIDIGYWKWGSSKMNQRSWIHTCLFVLICISMIYTSFIDFSLYMVTFIEYHDEYSNDYI